MCILKSTFIASSEVHWTQPKHLTYVLKNTGKAAQAINSSIYLLRPFQVTVCHCCVCIFRLTAKFSQLNNMPTPYSYIFSHFFKCQFAEVKMTCLPAWHVWKWHITNAHIFSSLSWHRSFYTCQAEFSLIINSISCVINVVYIPLLMLLKHDTSGLHVFSETMKYWKMLLTCLEIGCLCNWCQNKVDNSKAIVCILNPLNLNVVETILCFCCLRLFLIYQHGLSFKPQFGCRDWAHYMACFIPESKPAWCSEPDSNSILLSGPTLTLQK